MKRRLIKVPILTWTFLAVCTYNVYQVLYPDESCLQTATQEAPSNVYVFTRIPATKSDTKYKMIRRQYKHSQDVDGGESFTEVFVDMNGIKQADEWQESFEDTVYTDEPIAYFLESVAGNKRSFPENGIFVFVSDPLFDTYPNFTTTLQATVKSDRLGFYCLLGIEGEGCQRDYFAVNYRTAKLLRKMYLLFHRITHPNIPEWEVENQEPTSVEKYRQFVIDSNKVLNGSVKEGLLGSSQVLYHDQMVEPIKVEDNLVIAYSSNIEMAERFNLDRLSKLQPRYKPNNPQPLLRYLKRPISSCANGEIVVFVKTARSDEVQRQWIRKYMVKMAKIGQYQYDLIFLLGSGNDRYSAILSQEADDYNDILIGGFRDTYENLPIKTYLGYQYFAEFCADKKIVIFQDSDAFVMVDEVVKDFEIDYARAEAKEPWIRPILQGDTVYCIKGNTLPFKSTAFREFPGFGHHYVSKWYYWLSDIDPQYEIPKYCNGNCNALTGSAALRIWEQARNTDRKGFRIEDLYFLGYMRQKAEQNGTPIKVKAVAELNDYDGKRKVMFNRCLHMPDAQLLRNGSFLDREGSKNDNIEYRGQMATTEEKLDYVAEWYLSGNWKTYRSEFKYGARGDHLMSAT